MTMWIGFIWIRTGFREHGNKPSGFIKCGISLSECGNIGLSGRNPL